MLKPLAVIAGVGPGTGAKIALKFAQAYSVVLLARNPASFENLVADIKKNGGQAIGISTDVSQATSVKNAFDQISRDLKDVPMAAAVYNVGGKFVKKPFLELTKDDFVSGYDSNGLGAFLFSQAVIPHLLKATSLNYPPTLIFTGATASVKGSAMCSSFACGKWSQRALAQSLAREFGPQGLHVSHAIIDGVIDTEKTKTYTIGDGQPDAKIDPRAIADSYWNLHTQPRSAMTWEIDLRPYVEKW